MDTEALLRKHRKKLLFDLDSLPQRVEYAQQDIRRIIPHRDPLLLVDRISSLDLENRSIVAERWIDPKDPVLAGHFPDYPVYPGTLVMEMLGQAGVALCYFLEQNSPLIADDARPVIVRATKVLGAYFLEPVLPGAHLQLLGSQVVWDGMIARFFGQVVADGKIACVSMGEMLILRE